MAWDSSLLSCGVTPHPSFPPAVQELIIQVPRPKQSRVLRQPRLRLAIPCASLQKFDPESGFQLSGAVQPHHSFTEILQNAQKEVDRVFGVGHC